jgi:integrase
MTGLLQAVEEYLALRRAVGFKLEEAGRLLPAFVAHLDSKGATTITTPLALDWATSSPSPTGAAGRLQAVRGFAKYLQALDPRTEVPPDGMLDVRRHRPTPYLYSDADVASLMRTARSLQPPLWAATCETVIGLLWSTGMRIGEVVRLERADIAWDDGVLTVWLTKFAKSRHVPLDPSTLEALVAYDRLRRRHGSHPSPPSFFVSAKGQRLNYRGVHREFVRLLIGCGIASGRSARRPRIHDLRHSFAVRTMLGWYRAGEDVQALLPRLSTYLGHVDPSSTYWYLSAAPELLSLAAERLEPNDGWLS